MNDNPYSAHVGSVEGPRELADSTLGDLHESWQVTTQPIRSASGWCRLTGIVLIVPWHALLLKHFWVRQLAGSQRGLASFCFGAETT